MNKDNFTPIAFPYEGKYYITSIADPVLGDSVIAFNDFSKVYTFDEQRAEESDIIAYTKVIEIREDHIIDNTPTLIRPHPDFKEFDELVRSMHGKLTKKQSQEICEDIRREPKILPNDKCPCGSKETKIDVFVLHSLYDSGKTMYELENEFGIGRKIIGRLFKKHNLHIRTKSENSIGSHNTQFNGNPKYTENGYVEIWDGTKRILEHRYIMEQYILRKLSSTEVVHHINGIKDDNRIENLEICSPSEHMKKHKLPIGQWSHHYEFCLRCKTTDRKHASNGYCTKCNMYLRTVEKRGYETEYDENGERLFSETHRENLKKASILREFNKKFKKCCKLKK